MKNNYTPFLSKTKGTTFTEVHVEEPPKKEYIESIMTNSTDNNVIKEIFENPGSTIYKTTQKCCLCGKEFDGYGNDPRPIKSNLGDRCCDDCNKDIVIPTRLEVWSDDKITSLLVENDELKALNKVIERNYSRMRQYFMKYNIQQVIEDFENSLKEYKENLLKNTSEVFKDETDI